jgi:ABC-type branched-subunit amino acid transport system ATPase component/ABC-type branched-subunit amino acid transport system permease subunit
MHLGALTLGVLNGMSYGLLAVGLVLVYRSNKVLNLAHGQLGALSAVLLATFVVNVGMSYWIALPLSLAVGVLTGVAVERLFVDPLRRRTSSAVSQLLLTLGISQLLLALLFIPKLQPDPLKLSAQHYPVPFHLRFTFGGVVLGSQHLLILIVCPLLVAGLAVFLRYSLLGKKIRAAASNADAARLCGISPGRISATTWGIAGGLSAMSAILHAPSLGAFDGSGLGPDQLFVALGAAAFGAFVSIPWALAGGLTIGVVEAVVVDATSNAGTARLVVFVLVLGVIFAQGRAIASVFASRGAAVDDRPPLRIPAAVRERFLVRRQSPLSRASALLLLLLLPLLPGLTTEGRRFQLCLILIYAVVAVSLTMLVGWGGQLSLGHLAVVGLGAFVTARAAPHGWSVPALLLLAGAIGAASLVVVGLPALRVRGLTLAVTTLGFALVANEFLFRRHWLTGTDTPQVDVSGVRVLRGLGPIESMTSVYYLALTVLVAVFLTAQALRSSTPGRLMIAVRDDERTAAANGVTPATVKLVTLAVSGFFAGAAGVVWAIAWRRVTPDDFLPALSLSVLALPVIGGLGSASGAVAGAFALYFPVYFISPHLTPLFGEFGAQVGFQLAFSGLTMIGVLLAYPTGIAGAAQRGWEVLLAKIAVQLAARETVTPDDLALDVQDVQLRFGGVHALRGASIRVRPGEIVGLIGPNGAGKSTLLNVISGVFPADSGTVTLHGVDLAGLPADLRSAHGLGRSFQAAHLFPGLTLRETVQAMLGSRAGIGVVASMLRTPWTRRAERQMAAEADVLLERMGLSEYAHTLTSDLSTGTRRICDLTIQLAGRPKVLLLDEPTAGVAQRETEAFGPLLRRLRDELDCAIVIVEHDMPLLMGLCDRVYALELGAVIAEGTPEEVRQNPRVIASYLGTEEAAINRSGRGRPAAPKAASATAVPGQAKPAPRPRGPRKATARVSP